MNGLQNKALGPLVSNLMHTLVPRIWAMPPCFRFARSLRTNSRYAKGIPVCKP